MTMIKILLIIYLCSLVICRIVLHLHEKGLIDIEGEPDDDDNAINIVELLNWCSFIPIINTYLILDAATTAVSDLFSKQDES
jgi:hypothetical protein